MKINVYSENNMDYEFTSKEHIAAEEYINIMQNRALFEQVQKFCTVIGLDKMFQKSP